MCSSAAKTSPEQPHASTATPALELKGLDIGYSRPLLAGIDATLRPGHIAVLIGSNGAGKSTLLKTIDGTLRPLAGEICLCGKPDEALSARQKARMVAIVSTGRPAHTSGLTVAEAVAIGRQPYTGLLGSLTAHDREIVRNALSATGISHKAAAPLESLSDGEYQKAMIARAIAQATPLILMDEPTSFLDVAARIEIMTLLRRIADTPTSIGGGDESTPVRPAILLSTHDIAPALAAADDIWIAATDSPGGIISGPKDAIIASGAMDIPFHSRAIRFDPLTLEYRAR